MRTDAKLDREVAGIGGLSRDDLVVAWTKAYGRSPPKGIKRPLLELAAAWNLQARRLGGLPAASRKALLKAGSPAMPPVSSPKLQNDNAKSASRDLSQIIETGAIGLASGTRLMREWNGRMYVVDVTQSGFELDGKAYRSLSSIARRITGARWSGPRFFGL